MYSKIAVNSVYSTGFMGRVFMGRSIRNSAKAGPNSSLYGHRKQCHGLVKSERRAHKLAPLSVMIPT